MLKWMTYLEVKNKSILEQSHYLPKKEDAGEFYI